MQSPAGPGQGFGQVDGKLEIELFVFIQFFRSSEHIRSHIFHHIESRFNLKIHSLCRKEGYSQAVFIVHQVIEIGQHGIYENILYIGHGAVISSIQFYGATERIIFIQIEQQLRLLRIAADPVPEPYTFRSGFSRVHGCIEKFAFALIRQAGGCNAITITIFIDADDHVVSLRTGYFSAEVIIAGTLIQLIELLSVLMLYLLFDQRNRHIGTQQKQNGEQQSLFEFFHRLALLFLVFPDFSVSLY